MTSWEKYSTQATGWSEAQYADARTYLTRRAELVRSLGPTLAPGDLVLDLACGDGGLADFLPEQRYVGVDASEEMIAAGLARGRELVLADLNDYVPPQPVQATTIFRAIYYARDRRTLLEHIAGYTEVKLVFDMNPRQFRLADLRPDLQAAGFDRLDVRPFFVPQTRALPRSFALGLRSLERTGPGAGLVLRFRFTLLCSASRRAAAS
jgi:SAM-dependent methyltransferase